MNLWVYPLLLGSGKHAFADGTVPTALRLTESVTYPSGTLHLAYETAGVPTYGSLAIEEQDPQLLTGRDERAKNGWPIDSSASRSSGSARSTSSGTGLPAGPSRATSKQNDLRRMSNECAVDLALVSEASTRTVTSGSARHRVLTHSRISSGTSMGELTRPSSPVLLTPNILYWRDGVTRGWLRIRP